MVVDLSALASGAKGKATPSAGRPAPAGRLKRKATEALKSPPGSRTLRSQASSATAGRAPATTAPRPRAAAASVATRKSATASGRKPLAKSTAANRPIPTSRDSKRLRSSGAVTTKSKPTTTTPKEPVLDAGEYLTSEPQVPTRKKRPAWDTKGRLEDMEEFVGQLHHKLSSSTSEIGTMQSELERSQVQIQELEEFRRGLQTTVQVKEQENTQINHQLAELQEALSKSQTTHGQELTVLRSQHAQEVSELRASIANLKRDLKGMTADLDATQDRLRSQRQANDQLRDTISQQSAAHLALESNCQALKLQLGHTEHTLALRNQRIAQLEQQLTDSHSLTADLEARIRDEETIRRRLHNTIQELKGNIRVFCRVRPVLPSDMSESSASKSQSDMMPHIRFAEDDQANEIELVQIQDSTTTGKTTTKQYPFSFDRVFPPKSTQQEVFDEISQLVQSALDGYPVCIFAYGQTGSGKTHTMEGPTNPDEVTAGMIPRAVHQIFQTAEQLQSKGWSYTMEGQFLEIYNEAIHDLLTTTTNGSKKHEIKHQPHGKTVVTDLTTVALDTPAQVHQLLKRALHNRAVAATQCNERSSRSHSVFTLRLTGQNTITQESSAGVLNLIDLAGSERLSQSGSTGDRLKETQAINKSLSCLGDVIHALGNRDNHIPYRNSKLTYLLQNSLGGNSKTLMFVNVSPVQISFQETLCSLRFATKLPFRLPLRRDERDPMAWLMGTLYD
ncbi:kinesin-like nuclear fusion protein [Dimargaris verticillata]|uniref:Kinesin-like protein n=1 Tax=Dimargaris verticillata TaxID=2761393 RepID=A0A9W8B6A8_9FUNG|nr:kinesin-like nuclear fusion protein [Dimargaris verticillata]